MSLLEKPSIYNAPSVYNQGEIYNAPSVYNQGGDTANIGGREYRIVTIGTQTWMAENLDYKFSGCIIGGSIEYRPQAHYYNDDESTFGLDGPKKCGLLYNGYAANELENNKQTLIPGWHVPTETEFNNLFNAVGGSSIAGKKLKAKNNSLDGNSFPTAWNDIDVYGFKLLPTGTYNGTFLNVGVNSGLWSCTQASFWNNRRIYVTSGPDITFYSTDKSLQMPIRLVKDA